MREWSLHEVKDIKFTQTNTEWDKTLGHLSLVAEWSFQPVRLKLLWAAGQCVHGIWLAGIALIPMKTNH